MGRYLPAEEFGFKPLKKILFGPLEGRRQTRVHVRCATILPFTFGLLTYLLTYLLTPRSRVLLEELTGFAASQEIPRI